MQPKDVAIVMMMLGAFATAAWVVYLSVEAKKRLRKLQAQTELNGRLLDKFSSAHEVVEFLQTPGGAHFVDSLSSEKDDPANGILRSVHRGIVLALVGIGFLVLTVPYGWENNPLLVLGVVMLCMGIGFLASATVSNRLARTLGLIGHDGNPK